MLSDPKKKMRYDSGADLDDEGMGMGRCYSIHMAVYTLSLIPWSDIPFSFLQIWMPTTFFKCFLVVTLEQTLASPQAVAVVSMDLVVGDAGSITEEVFLEDLPSNFNVIPCCEFRISWLMSEFFIFT